MQNLLGDNPFSALTLIAAPAILTNAMSVLALGSGNRVARVLDRYRELENQSPTDPDRLRRLDRLRTRARLLLRAMQAFFTALGCFASTTLIAIVGTALLALGNPGGAKAVACLSIAVGSFGVLSLLYGCTAVVRDTRLAVLGLEDAASRLSKE